MPNRVLPFWRKKLVSGFGYLPLSLTGFVLLVFCGLYVASHQQYGGWTTLSQTVLMRLHVPMNDRLLFGAAWLTLILVGICVAGISFSAFLIVRQLRGVSHEAVHGAVALSATGALSSGGWSVTRLRFGAFSRIPLVHISIKWDCPAGVDVRIERGREEWRPRERGYTEHLVRRVRIADTFGLSSVSFKIKGGSVRIAAADASPDRNISLLQAVASGESYGTGGSPDGDPLDMRQYRQGDSAKRMLWKVVARTGGQRLYVRTPELVTSHAFAIFFVAGNDDEPGAALARYLVQHNPLRQDWVFGVSTASGSGKTFRNSDAPEMSLNLLSITGTERRNADYTPEYAASRVQEFLQSAQREKCAVCLVILPPGGIGKGAALESLGTLFPQKAVMPCQGLMAFAAGDDSVDEQHFSALMKDALPIGAIGMRDA